MKRAALYFGTFNPLHIGHVTILRHLAACKAAGEIDKACLVVSPQSPFKEGCVASAEQRLQAVRQKVSALGIDAEVSDVEFGLPAPWYTVNTLAYLQAQNPDWQHILVMGADNILGIERWHKGCEILDTYEIWVYPRPGYDVEAFCERLRLRRPKARIKMLTGEQNDISSTQIRAGEISPMI